LNITLKDHNGNPLSGKTFFVFQDGNLMTTGTLDLEGKATVDNIAADKACEIEVEGLVTMLTQNGSDSDNDSLPKHLLNDPKCILVDESINVDKHTEGC
jgi:hypothetical protein